MQKTVLLSKIKDNPFRDKKRNPIDQDKVESIAESIETTKEFWRGVYGREVENGYVEIAFGHHRVDAARMAGLTEVRVEVEKFSDGDMLMWMARENVQGSVPIMMEAISAAVKALTDGKIEFPPLGTKIRKEIIRYAPSFIPGASTPTMGVDRPYTLQTLMRFLGGNYIKASTGEPKHSAVAAMARLEAEERGWLKNIKKEELDKLDVQKTIKQIGEIARIEKAKEKSVREVQKAEQDLVDRKRKAETEQRERDKQIAAEKQKALELAAQERIEEDKRKVAKQKQRVADLEEKAKEKAVIDSVKISVLEAKVREIKAQQEKASKEAERTLIVREGAALLVLINAPEPFEERLKAYFRKKLTAEEREIMRQALTSRGERLFDMSRMGLPPLTAKQWSQLYSERERSKRAQDTAAQAKKETKKKK